MAELPDIDELTKDLDPQARSVVVLMHGMLTSMMERLEGTIEKLQAENAELKRMLFGQRSERRVMPSAKREGAKRARATETAEEKARRDATAQEQRQARKQARKKLPTVEERLSVSRGPRPPRLAALEAVIPPPQYPGSATQPRRRGRPPFSRRVGSPGRPAHGRGDQQTS